MSGEKGSKFGCAEEPNVGSLGRCYRSCNEWGKAVAKYTGQRKP